MKKKSALILAAVVAVSALTGCPANKETESVNVSQSKTESIASNSEGSFDENSAPDANSENKTSNGEISEDDTSAAIQPITLHDHEFKITNGVLEKCYIIEGNVVIPEGVVVIDEHAFFDCENFVYVSIPDGVTTIEQGAFDRCNINMMNLPDSIIEIFESDEYISVTYKGNTYEQINDELCKVICYDENGLLITSDGVLKDCLDSVNGNVIIPESVTGIYESAFKYRNVVVEYKGKTYNIDTENDMLCKAICYDENGLFISDDGVLIDCLDSTEGNVTIPNDVTAIGDCAFLGCNKITDVIIPYGVTRIGNNAFRTSSVKSINIPDSITTIGDEAFLGCWEINEISLGNGVIIIGDDAFAKCVNLSTVTLGDSVTEIGDYAFCDCESLTEIIIGDSVVSIGDYAFGNCEQLSNVVLGKNVKTIGSEAFYRDEKLLNVELPDSVTGVYENFLRYDTSVTYKGTTYSYDDRKEFARAVCYDENGLYITEDGVLRDCLGCKGDMVIPDSVKVIADYAFEGCSGMTGVTIPASVKSIGRMAFSGCDELVEVTIPDGVESIDGYAFSYCEKLENIYLPDSLIRIGTQPFNQSTSVTATYNGKTYTIGNLYGAINAYK